MTDTFDVEVIASPELWQRLRTDPKFIELMRVARVANALSLVWAPFTTSVSDQRPSARRARFNALAYAGALVWEGMLAAEGLAKWFRDYPEYRDGFGAIQNDERFRSLRNDYLGKVRKKLVFHFERDALAEGLARLHEGEIVVASYPLGESTMGETYFDLADIAALGFIVDPSTPTEEYAPTLGKYVDDVTDLVVKYFEATHSIVNVALREFGCRQRKVVRECVEPDDAIHQAMYPHRRQSDEGQKEV